MKLLWTLLLSGSLAVAAEPFTGTWKIDVSKVQFPKKPDRSELANGTYKCLTCDPPITIKADGSDQPVSGHSGFDAMSVKIIDDYTVEIARKKADRLVSDGKMTVSADGSTATVEFTSYPQSSDKPVTGTVTEKRVGKPMPGMHAISGSWVAEKAENFSDNALLLTFEESSDGLKMSQATGEHFDAKFDGKEYPYEGSPNISKVVLKRLGQREIEETDKRPDGKVEGTQRMTVAPDGQTMTMVIRDRQGRVVTLVWNKQ